MCARAQECRMIPRADHFRFGENNNSASESAKIISDQLRDCIQECKKCQEVPLTTGESARDLRTWWYPKNGLWKDQNQLVFVGKVMNEISLNPHEN